MAIGRIQPAKRTHRRDSQSGFGVIEVLLAMVIIMVGLLSLLALFSQAIATTQLSQLDMIARQKAREALEAIHTARNTQQVPFEQLKNVPEGGIFLTGFRALRLPNPTTGGGDGIVGTADDGDVEQIVLLGHDGLRGTADDRVFVLDQFSRRITLTAISGDLSRIQVEVRFNTPWGTVRNYQIESFISRYR